jgi:hypothetical protein
MPSGHSGRHSRDFLLRFALITSPMRSPDYLLGRCLLEPPSRYTQRRKGLVYTAP